MKIIVGHDGTEPSTQAVRWAADEAAARGATLVIRSCVAIPIAGEAISGWVATEAMTVMVEASDQQLAGLRTTLAATHPGLGVETETSLCPVGAALLEDLEPDDLVVVGSSHHAGAAAFWLGSTPRHLVHTSPCPVVVVRGPASSPRPERVVVGIDGSPTSDAALHWAADEADLYGVGLCVVHSWTDPFVADDAASVQATDLTRIDARCVLDKAIEIARERCGAKIEGELIEGIASTVLLAEVADGDLLVLGSHGRGAIAAGVLGSTVNGVLDHAAVPVVVVKPAPDTARH